MAYVHLYSISWLAWTCDALDFFTVSLTLSSLAAQFGVATSEIVRFDRRIIICIPSQLMAYIDDRHHAHLALQIGWRC